MLNMKGGPDFDLVSRRLRGEIIEHYYYRGESIADRAGLTTLETNSSLVPQRARLLIELIERRGGHDSIEGLEVADLGCGFGAMSLYFACAGARVTGVDANPERFAVGARIAGDLGLDARFRLGWLEALPLGDSRFDLLVLNNSFCYLTESSDRRSALDHLHRVARPGACLVMRNPSLAALRDPFTGMPLVHQLPGPVAKPLLRLTQRGRTRSEVRLRPGSIATRELRRAGFEDVRVERGVSERRPGRYQHITARRQENDGQLPSGP
jgi:SAM-dependent methyltransferase